MPRLDEFHGIQGSAPGREKEKEGGRNSVWVSSTKRGAAAAAAAVVADRRAEEKEKEEVEEEEEVGGGEEEKKRGAPPPAAPVVADRGAEEKEKEEVEEEEEVVEEEEDRKTQPPGEKAAETSAVLQYVGRSYAGRHPGCSDFHVMTLPSFTWERRPGAGRSGRLRGRKRQ